MYYYIPIPSQRIHAKEKKKKEIKQKAESQTEPTQPRLLEETKKKTRRKGVSAPHQTQLQHNHNSNPTHLKSQSQHNQEEDPQR